MKFYNEYLYCIHCAILGDIIGFGNGSVEFNFNQNNLINTRSDVDKLATLSNTHVANFIARGGYTNIDISKDIVSDDSILLLAVLDAMTKIKSKNLDEIIETIKLNFNEFYKKDKKRDERYYGIRTIKSLKRIDEGKNWDKYSYSETSGGCGASIRCMSIGMILHEEKEIDKLIEISIQSSRITHNNAIGYLGGLSSAYLTSLAIKKINPEKWIFNLLELLKSDKLKKFIKEVVCKEFPDDINKHYDDLKYYTNLVRIYIDLRFDNEKHKNDIFMRLFDRRSQFYYDNFASSGIYKKYFNPGSNGLDSIIIAYDCFLDCKGSFETLIYYSMLHAGDSDSTGCIAGAFYGAYYGKFDLPKNMYNIELFKEMKHLVDTI